ISFECEHSSGGRHRISSGSYYDDDGDCTCTEGPARVALAVRGGKITRVRVFVGGEERSPGGAAVTDLGAVAAAAATRFLLDVAARAGGEVGREAVFPTILADSVTVWPDLLRLARDTRVAQETRPSARDPPRPFILSHAFLDAPPRIRRRGRAGAVARRGLGGRRARRRRHRSARLGDHGGCDRGARGGPVQRPPLTGVPITARPRG